MPSTVGVCGLKTMASASIAVAAAAHTSAFAISVTLGDGLAPEWPPPVVPILNVSRPNSLSDYYSASLTNVSHLPWVSSDDVEGPYNNSYTINETQCEEWQPAQHTLFQTANLCYAAAFLIPHNFKLSMLLMRSILSCGFLMFTLWGGVYICSPDIFAWNLAFVIVNLIHVIYLSYKYFPPRIKPEFVELFTKLFKPLNMDKSHFKELVRDAELVQLDEGAHYAIEDVTSADERLSILLNGKLKVTCEDAHLHYILPNEFIDSPEWEACPTDSDELFQVTITAAEPSQYICWQRRKLQHVLRNKPFLDSVIYNLIGKDITQKLYSLNEHMNPFNRSKQHPGNTDIYWKHFPRSLSVDVVATGTKGHVRSHLWRMQSRRASSANSDSLGSSPARTSRYSHLSDPGPNRSPLRIPPVIVGSDTTTMSGSRSGSGSGSGSESAYVTATSPAPSQLAPIISNNAPASSSSSLHSPPLTPTVTVHEFSITSFSSSASPSTAIQPSLHVAFETPV